MPTTITFENLPVTPDGLFSTYSDQGYAFSTRLLDGAAPNAFWSGQVLNDLGTGGYILINNSNDTAVVRAEDGKTFGVLSVDVNGFAFTGEFSPDGEAVVGTTEVTFVFTGLLPNLSTVSYTFTTDDIDSFETVSLPDIFGAGLIGFEWRAGTGTAWGSFDNLVLQPNRAPEAYDFAGSGDEDHIFTGQLAASDPDLQPVTFEVVGSLPSGVLLESDGSFKVTPFASDQGMGAGDSRTVAFQYRVTDGDAVSAVRTSTVTLQGVNDAPTAADDERFTFENLSLLLDDLLGNDSDPDNGDTLTLVSIDPIAGVTKGLLVGNGDGSWSYDPGQAFEGLKRNQVAVDTFTYVMRDAAGALSTGTTTVSVIGRNDAPTAVDDNVTVTAQETVVIDALANDFDIDEGDLIGPSAVSGAASGATVTFEAGKFVYHADLDSFTLLGEGETFTDSFTYTIEDRSGIESTATVTVVVEAPPIGPDICGGNRPQFLTGTSLGEHICGGNSGDTLCGLAGADTISGDNGRDSLCGGAGPDLLLGGNGNDTLSGGNGGDRLVGGNGVDILDGGVGSDTMTGDNGADEFHYGDLSGHDVITDFNDKNETIQISPTMVGSFGDLMSMAYQEGDDVIIVFDGNNSLTLWDVELFKLDVDNFIFA